jgi:GGDEF domain-containing protein
MGRDCGNRFIQLYSRKLENCVRSTNIMRDTFGTEITTNLARTSGDKFSIFLGHIENPQHDASLSTPVNHSILMVSSYSRALKSVSQFFRMMQRIRKSC